MTYLPSRANSMWNSAEQAAPAKHEYPSVKAVRQRRTRGKQSGNKGDILNIKYGRERSSRWKLLPTPSACRPEIRDSPEIRDRKSGRVVIVFRETPTTRSQARHLGAPKPQPNTRRRARLLRSARHRLSVDGDVLEADVPD